MGGQQQTQMENNFNSKQWSSSGSQNAYTQGSGSAYPNTCNSLEVLNNVSNQSRAALCSDENQSFGTHLTGSGGSSQTELQKELAETKDKLKVITNKFITVRKERDTLKQENKELQEEVLHL